jgi:hypothetical protein
MTTRCYYDRGGVRVTDANLIVNYETYEIVHIRYIWTSSRPVPGVRPVLLTLAPSEVAALLFAWSKITGYLAGVLVSLATAAVGVVVVVSACIWPYSHEVWVEFDDMSLKIYAASHEWQAAQLARAINRARLAGEDRY